MAPRPRRLASVLVAALLLVAAVAPPAFAKPGDGVLLLDSYSTKPAEVLLGEEFELRLTFSNVGSKKAEDLLVTLGEGSPTAGSADAAGGGAPSGGGSASPLVVVGGGNTKHVDLLGADDAQVVSFRLLSDPAAAPGLVALPVTLEYTSGGPRSLSQTVGIVLRRPTRLRVVSMTAPDEAVTGEPFDVVAEIMNAGDAKVSAVSMMLAGKAADVENGRVFLGNLESGDGDVLESTVTLQEPGTSELTLTIEYLDEFGDTRTLEETLEVKASAGESETVDVPEEESSDTGFFAGIARFFRALFGLGE